VVVHGWYVKDLTGRMQKCGPGIPAAWTRVRPPPSSSRWQDGCYCNGDQTKHRPSLRVSKHCEVLKQDQRLRCKAAVDD
jgi:hypothetical protein